MITPWMWRANQRRFKDCIGLVMACKLELMDEVKDWFLFEPKEWTQPFEGTIAGLRLAFALDFRTLNVTRKPSSL
jgi:hypothetical protein